MNNNDDDDDNLLLFIKRPFSQELFFFLLQLSTTFTMTKYTNTTDALSHAYIYIDIKVVYRRFIQRVQ